MNTTSSAAIGRRRTLRSPLLNIGTSSRSAPKTSGPATMMIVSRWCGAIASTAKYQRKYQSGRGYASRRLGSGGGPSSGGPTMTREERHGGDHRRAEDHVAPGRVGPEGNSLPAEQLVVATAIGGRVHRVARPGTLGDPVAQHQHQVQPDEQEHQRRDEEDVKGEEPAQRGAADGLAREDEARDLVAHDRHASRLCRAHDDRPDGGLVPPEQLAGERQREGEQQEDRAGEPVELAGELVRGHQVGAGHVDADQQHHGRCAEIVHAAEESAEQRLLRDELAGCRTPGRSRARRRWRARSR